MDSNVNDMMLASVPDDLKKEVSGLVQSARTAEELRLRERREEGRMHGNCSDREIQLQAERHCENLAIAKLVMEVWSSSMRCHVEQLILKKAVAERYLLERQLKWVTVLNEDKTPSPSDKDWVIDDQDELLVDLLWNVFNLSDHFKLTNSHRVWIKRSYDRLGSFMPELHPEIIERHDLTKFSLNQAIGYTIKWVHDNWSEIWSASCNLHLHNEPHHVQMWSSVHTPSEKRRKLELWTKDVCDFHEGCPYGITIATISLKSEEMALPFLQESFIDMVAVEWERKKGKRRDITNADLSFIHERFLVRYKEKQKQYVRELMQRIREAGEPEQHSVD